MTSLKITYISLEDIVPHSPVSIQVTKMCDAMMAEGHDVRLIAPIPKPDGSVAQIMGLRHEIHPVYRPLPPSHLGRAYYAMMGRLSSLGRIAYTRFGSCAAICLYTGARTVLFDLDALPKPDSLADRILKRLLRNRSSRLRIVVLTEALRRMLSERYPFAYTDNILVAPDGVDPVQFDSVPDRDKARKILNLPADQPIVGHIGSLSPTNGVETLAGLVAQMPEIHFLMVGDRGRGGGLDRVRDAATASGNLTAPGNVNQSQIPLWLSACDVLLLANRILPGFENRNALYTSPMKLFEYMASGRPIIASDLSILREVLDDDTAVLVPPEDIAAWTKAIRDLIRDPNWGNALGSAARRKATELYSWQARARTILRGL